MSGTSTDWYEAAPQCDPTAGILLLHSAWGLTECHRLMGDRLASAGFHVVVPDLYNGAVAASWEEAQQLRLRRRSGDRWTAISRATSHLRWRIGGSSRIGVVGFSMGGHWALFLAQRGEVPVAATVSFYAVRGGDYRNSRSAFQIHLPTADEFLTAGRVERLRQRLEAACRPNEFFTYPGARHWFCEEQVGDSFDAAAAALAWERTEAFVQRHLIGVDTAGGARASRRTP